MANLSANCAEDVAMRARMIAHKEGRTVSNFVENALAVFTMLPKDLRDLLIAAYQTDRKQFSGTMKRVHRLVAQDEFLQAMRKAAMSVPDSSDLARLSEMPEHQLLDAISEKTKGL